MTEILFLPLDASFEQVQKGPNAVRPPAAMRKPTATPGPQPKLGASGSPPGGMPKAPSMPKMPSSPGGGKEYDYVQSDTPPPGNEGKTKGGYWKVPKGMSAPKQMSAEATEQKTSSQQDPNKVKDPLSGATVSKLDQRVQQAHAESQGRNTLAPGKKRKTQVLDTHSTDPASFKDAQPEAHYALADKFRKEKDDKLADFHENLAKEKTANFSDADHEHLKTKLTEYGLHDYADKHEYANRNFGKQESTESETGMEGQPRVSASGKLSVDGQDVGGSPALEHKEDPEWEPVDSVDDEPSDPVAGQKVEDLDQQAVKDPEQGPKVTRSGDVEVDGKKPGIADSKKQSDKQKELASKRPLSQDQKDEQAAKQQAAMGPNGERFDLKPGSEEHKAATKQGKDEPDAVYRKRMEHEHGVVVDPKGIEDQHPDIQKEHQRRKEQVAKEFEQKRQAHWAQGQSPADGSSGPNWQAAGADPVQGQTVDQLDSQAAAQPGGIAPPGAGDPMQGQQVSDLGQDSASKKAKQAIDEHKASGAKAQKELKEKHSAAEKELSESHKKGAKELAEGHSKKGQELAEKHSAKEKELKEKHSAKEKELTSKHSAKEKALKEKHSEREKELTSKHSAKEKELTSKHEEKAKAIQEKHSAKAKELQEEHRSAQDEHLKATKRLQDVRGSKDKEKVRQAQADVHASKQLVMESKRKMDDHKPTLKPQMDAHKASASKELEAHREKAKGELAAHRERAQSELSDHQSKAKSDLANHKTDAKAELESHKATSKKEVEQHKATVAKETSEYKELSEKRVGMHREAAKKELDAHGEAHAAKAKELGEQHEAAKVQDSQRAQQQKAEAKAQAQQQKEQAKADAEAQKNEKRTPGTPHEELQAKDHQDKARKTQENIKSHLDNPDLDPETREKLEQAHSMLQEHIDGGHVPTPEMKQQLKDITTAAGEHGKKPDEAAQARQAAGGGSKASKTPGIGATMAGGYAYGEGVGTALGSGAASPYSGALGRNVIQYGAKGVASGGHYLLNPPSGGKSDSEKATQKVAETRHQPSEPAGSEDGGGEADASTATVSAGKVKKSIPLYVPMGWRR